MIILAKITRLIHYLILIFILIGHALLPLKYLKYYLLLIIFIMLDWNDFDGQCTLTKLEYYFKTGNWSSKSPVEGGPEFFRPLINKLFNLKLSHIEGDRLNNFLFIMCWLIAYLRIYNYIIIK